MFNHQHLTFNILILTIAIALIIHTIAEAWLPVYQRVRPDWRSVVLDPILFRDNVPFFILSLAGAVLGWQWPIIGGILPAVGLTHPLLDHLGLSWKNKRLRPGSWTGLLLLWPLSLGTYIAIYRDRSLTVTELLVSVAIGLGVSFVLLWLATQESATPHEQ
jgi:uncharacterized membrane protein HdeD (DUF308 family)